MSTAENPDIELSRFVARFKYDPLGYVQVAFPWGELGTQLENHQGPCPCQIKLLTILGEQMRLRMFDGHTAVAPIRMGCASGHGIGKAQPSSLEIDTPDGIQEFGELSIGDGVFTPTGSAIITHIHERGILPVYRVSFNDGSFTLCCPDHLWTVQGRQQRRGRSTWTTMSTSDLVKAGIRRANGSVTTRQFRIPNIQAVEYRQTFPAIPAYLMGAWLGDGGRNSGRITSADVEVVERIRSLGEDIHPNVGSYAWQVKGLKVRLREVGVLESYSYEKRIPAVFLQTSSADRAELLRGLLDTDGECNAAGSVIFNSTSAVLASNVAWLVRSLGGRASLQPTTKKPVFKDSTGKAKNGRDCHRVTIQMPHGFLCFYVKRKQARVRYVESRYLARWIESVEPAGSADCRCITISNPDGLYLTNDFIPTHNSAFFGMVSDWIRVCWPYSQGSATANTFTQLSTKTWANIKKWQSMSICSHWFEASSERIYHPMDKDSWFLSTQSSAADNSEAFAGQHAQNSISYYINDECSGIADIIFEVQEGGLTDGCPIQFAFGNLTKQNGKFARIMQGKESDWITVRIDSRECPFTNKALIQEWCDNYGEDSDFFKVRVRGLPPSVAFDQFIGADLVAAAQSLQRISSYVDTDALIAGCDLSWGGEDSCCVRFRRGCDARSIPPIYVKGELTRDPNTMVQVLSKVLTTVYNGRKVEMLFIDSAGICGPIVRRLREMGFENIIEVNFGAHSSSPKYKLMRSYMIGMVKEALPQLALDNSPDLADDMTALEYSITSKTEILIAPKEQIRKPVPEGLGRSTDDLDALALTYAMPVVSKQAAAEGRRRERPRVAAGAWS